MARRSEAELYLPIKKYFQTMGFEVKAEVNRCDLVAVRGEDMVIVELKTTFNLTLLLQGIDRQKKSDLVFLAIEMPKNLRRYPHWRETIGLCRRLGLGLLTVRFSSGEPRVELQCPPGPYKAVKSKKRQTHILHEFQSRSGDYNIGGVTKRPLMTAYREDALRIAYYLHVNGPSKIGVIRERLKNEKVGSILQKNFYQWFMRTERGIYALTAVGEKALRTYHEVIKSMAIENIGHV